MAGGVGAQLLETSASITVSAAPQPRWRSNAASMICTVTSDSSQIAAVSAAIRTSCRPRSVAMLATVAERGLRAQFRPRLSLGLPGSGMRASALVIGRLQPAHGKDGDEQDDAQQQPCRACLAPAAR